MADFDPDAYLKKYAAPNKGFDPDAYLEKYGKSESSPVSSASPQNVSAVQDFGLKENPYPDNIPPGPSERSHDSISEEESKPDFGDSTAQKTAALMRVAARTIGAGIGHGVKGLLENDPAAVYSRMDEKDRKAAEEHLDSQIAPIQQAVEKDRLAKNPATGNYYGDELHELERHKLLIQRGREIKGDPSADPALYEEALKPEQLERDYETDPRLENTPAAAAARIAGGIGGFVAEGAINPALPLSQMVLSARSEAGDAAVNAAKSRGETDEKKLGEIRDSAAKKAGEFAAATIPIYMAGGTIAGTTGKALGPAASALTKAAVETGVSAASNIAIGAGMRRLENGKWSLPTGEQVSQDIGWALLHGYGAFKGAEKDRQAEQQEFKKAIQEIPDDQFAAAIRQFRELPPKDPRRTTFEAEIVRRGQPDYAPAFTVGRVDVPPITLGTGAPSPTATPEAPPPQETPQAPNVQPVSQANTGGRSAIFQRLKNEEDARKNAQALRDSITPEAKELAPATAAATEKLADAIESAPSKAPVETPAPQPIAEKKAPAEETVAPKESAPVEPISQQEQPGVSEQSEPPVNLTPAVKTDDGIVTGENHPEIIEREGLEPEVRETKDAGFVTPEGEFRTREQAAEETGLPTNKEQGKLHSSDLPKKTFPKLDAFEKSLEDEPKTEDQDKWRSAVGRAPRVKVNPEDPDNRLTRPDLPMISSNAAPGTAIVFPDGRTGVLSGRKKNLATNSREILLDNGNTLEWSPAFSPAFSKEAAAKYLESASETRLPATTKEEKIARLEQELKEAPNRDKKAIRERIKALSEEPQSEEAQEPESSEKPKEIWQKTREEIKAEGASLARHSLEVKDALKRGEKVPLEVLEDFKGREWADKARQKIYGEEVSDTLLGRIAKALEDDPTKLYSDPLLIQTIGKPVLRQAVKVLRASLEAGKLAKDAVEDAIAYLKANAPSFTEEKVRTLLGNLVSDEDQTKGGDSDERTEEKGQKEGVLNPPGEGEAVPSPSPEPGDHAAYNAATDEALKKAGFEPIAAPARKTLGISWDEALAATAKANASGEDIGGNLVDELNSKPRTLKDDVESGILLKEIADRKKTQAAAQERVDEAQKSGDEGEIASAVANLETARNRTYEAITAAKKTGTEWGRAGRFRQIHIDDGYNITSMEAKVRSEANNGKPLTKEQVAEVKASAEEIEKARKYDEMMESAKKDAEAATVADDLQKKVSKQAKESEAKGKGFLEFLDEQAEKARKRIIADRGAMYMAVEPVTPIAKRFINEAIIGAAHIAHGIVDFGKWSRKMIADFGPRVSPHLPEIFNLASEKNAELQEQHAKANDPEQSNEKEVSKLVSEQKSAGAELNPKIVYDLAVLHAKEGVGKQGGVEGMNELIKAVHADLVLSRDGLTERDVRDAFSGYGKVKHPSKEQIATQLREVRRLSQLQSGIEDALENIAPKKSGTQRDKPTQAVREQMRKLQDAMRKAGIETASPEQQLASVNAARETAIQNRIEDIKNEIATGQKPTKPSPVDDSEKVKFLKAERQRLQDQLDAINEAKNPKKTPEQIQNERYRTLLAKRKADLEARLAKGDFTKPVRNKLQLDRQSEQAKADYERSKQKFDTEVEKQRRSNRTRSQKFWDGFVSVERAMKLTSAAVFGKLGVAAAARAVLTPIEEGVGAAIGKALPGLEARAPRQGKLSPEAESKAFASMFTTGMRDAYNNLRMKKSNLDVLNNRNRMRDIPPAWYEYMGFLHAALKAPIKRAEFERSLAKRIQFARENGQDITDPNVMTALSQSAYVDANRSIFMQDNWATKGFSGLKRIVEGAGAPGAARLMQFLVPIVKVPTNIVGEAYEGTPVSLAHAAVKTAKAYMKGIDQLPPEEADFIMRQLKKGLIGTAALTFGYLAANSIGGFYRKGEKRKDSDLKSGEYKIGGEVMPKWFGHTPIAMLMNLGATAARARKEGAESGVIEGAKGFAREVPFVPAATNLIDALGNENATQRYIATMIEGTAEPSILPQIARAKDTPGTFPKNILTPARQRESRPGYVNKTADELKLGIPGLREQVPLRSRRRLKSIR